MAENTCYKKVQNYVVKNVSIEYCLLISHLNKLKVKYLIQQKKKVKEIIQNVL